VNVRFGEAAPQRQLTSRTAAMGRSGLAQNDLPVQHAAADLMTATSPKHQLSAGWRMSAFHFET